MIYTGKTKYAPSAFAHFCPSPLCFVLFFRLLFPLISLLFIHGELILGCGSQKCKLEADLPSKAQIASHLMFCSLALETEKNCTGREHIVQLLALVRAVYLLSSLACFLTLSIHLLRIVSSSQVTDFSQLLDRLRAASWWFRGLL